MRPETREELEAIRDKFRVRDHMGDRRSHRLSDRVVSSTTYEDDIGLIVEVECAACGRVFPVVPLYRMEHCPCGRKLWRNVER